MRIQYRNREFTVIERKNVREHYPNIFEHNPRLETFFIAEGKRGKIISGYLTKSGKVISLD